MADALTDFIIKPAAPFAAGVVLFVAVWGCFKGVESILSDDTKLEIAVWLLGVKIGQKVEPWPKVFLLIIGKVVGVRHPTWKGLRRSFVVTFFALFLVGIVVLVETPPGERFLYSKAIATAFPSLPTGWLLLITIIVSFLNLCETSVLFCIPDYVTMILLQKAVSLFVHSRKQMPELRTLILGALLPISYAAIIVVIGDIYIWEILRANALLHTMTESRGLHIEDTAAEIMSKAAWYRNGISLGDFIKESMLNATLRMWWNAVMFGFPLYLSSVWLWLYAASGFLLKFARRFDIGFQWFNSHVDIEEKPLSAIGLVAGALVAVLWWTVVLVKWLV